MRMGEGIFVGWTGGEFSKADVEKGEEVLGQGIRCSSSISASLGRFILKLSVEAPSRVTELSASVFQNPAGFTRYRSLPYLSVIRHPMRRYTWLTDPDKNNHYKLGNLGSIPKTRLLACK